MKGLTAVPHLQQFWKFSWCLDFSFTFISLLSESNFKTQDSFLLVLILSYSFMFTVTTAYFGNSRENLLDFSVSAENKEWSNMTIWPGLLWYEHLTSQCPQFAGRFNLANKTEFISWDQTSRTLKNLFNNLKVPKFLSSIVFLETKGILAILHIFKLGENMFSILIVLCVARPDST